MVQPSQAWLDKFDGTLVPETFVRITYSMTEPGLQDDALPSTNGEVPFSTVSSVTNTNKNNTLAKYATGELNLTVLDGFSAIPDLSSVQDAGYISSALVSESAHPTITFSFSSVHTVSIPGVVITWSNTFDEWATKFKLSVYNGSSEIFATTVEGNTSAVYNVEHEIVDYDSIKIEVMEWCLPYRRARVETVQFGGLVVFTKDNIISYEHGISVLVSTYFCGR